MTDLSSHIILHTSDARTALQKLNELPLTPALFVVDEEGKLIGMLSDSDIRNGLLNDLPLSTPVSTFAQASSFVLKKGSYTVADIQAIRQAGGVLFPIVDENGEILRVCNFNKQRSFLPLDVVIIAGGLGTRLQPLTNSTPKPLLSLAGKPIIAHILDRLSLFGIRHSYLSIGYKAEQFKALLGDYTEAGLAIEYIHEETPLGTFGPIGKIKNFESDVVLVMNADLLTNIDLEDMMLTFEEEEADMMVASIPYEVPIPYAILETDGNRITEFHEKPTYTYYANAGIYLVKKELLKKIPVDEPYQATDLMRELIDTNHKVCYYPILGYWLDIGTPQDYEKAKRDIAHIQF